MKFYIKMRDNPQTGISYYAEGQLTKKQAKQKEKTLYGANTLLSYPTESEYVKALEYLESCGYRVIKNG